jgi:sterol desaturase/sphingolipid hydroxylase (fatty acid hydroxylase superfamily)
MVFSNTRYMFVHDGMVHKRFPVGPIGDVPYLRKIAAAHKIHHSEYFDGVPYGLFLSIQVWNQYQCNTNERVC